MRKLIVFTALAAAVLLCISPPSYARWTTSRPLDYLSLSDADDDPWSDPNLNPNRQSVNDKPPDYIPDNPPEFTVFFFSFSEVMQYLTPIGPYFVFKLEGHKNSDVNDLEDINRECREFDSTGAVQQSNQSPGTGHPKLAL